MVVVSLGETFSRYIK